MITLSYFSGNSWITFALGLVAGDLFCSFNCLIVLWFFMLHIALCLCQHIWRSSHPFQSLWTDIDRERVAVFSLTGDSGNLPKLFCEYACSPPHPPTWGRYFRVVHLPLILQNHLSHHKPPILGQCTEWPGRWMQASLHISHQGKFQDYTPFPNLADPWLLKVNCPFSLFSSAPRLSNFYGSLPTSFWVKWDRSRSPGQCFKNLEVLDACFSLSFAEGKYLRLKWSLTVLTCDGFWEVWHG